VYNIGPFSGSNNILNVLVSIASASADLGSSLNFSTPAMASQAVSGPGVRATVGLQAQPVLSFA